jgi:hypothetical protein
MLSSILNIVSYMSHVYGLHITAASVNTWLKEKIELQSAGTSIF